MQATKSKQTQEFQRMANDKFISEVVGVGDILRRNQVSANKGNESGNTKRVDEAYRQFTSELKDQRQYMKTASEEQKEVFREVIEEFMKLRKDGKYDFDRSHKEFQAAVARINEVEGSAEAKAQIEKIAAIGMQHTDPSNRKRQGVVSAEIDHRLTNFFKMSDKDRESPLFRRIAGMDKVNHKGMVTPLQEMQNLGQAEAVKKRLSDDIMGEGQQGEHEDHDSKLVSKIVMAMSGKGGTGGGAFPSKIENLHVEKLIVKMVERDHSGAEGEKKPPFYVAPTLPPNDKGRSAVPVGTPELPPPSGVSATFEVKPQLPPPSGAAASLIEAPTQRGPSGSAVPLLTQQDGDYLPVPKVPTAPEGKVKVKSRPVQDVTDVAYKDIEPIKVKGNPMTPLRTNMSPMASAVSGAVAAMPVTSVIGNHATLIDSFKDTYKDNDVGVRNDESALKPADDGKGDDGGLGLPDVASLLPALLGGGKGKAEKEKVSEKEKVKAKEKVSGEAEKLKGTNEGKAAAKAAEGLEGEAKGAGKALGKVSKGLGHAGKVLGIAGTAITAYDAYNEYSDADKLQKSGKLTAQQAKEAKAKAVGGGTGAVAGGWAGAEAGAAAGAAIGSFIMPGVGTVAGGLIGGAAGAFGGSELGDWAGRKLGGLWAANDKNDSGKQVAKASAEHKEVTKQEAKAPVIVHAPTTNVQGGGSGGDLKVMPSTASPRTRESYFDRAMLGAFVL
jgi:hypothetical protein